MSLIEIIIISISLAMDAFAAALCKGLTMKKNYKNAIIIGLYFGLFQALMPLIGYVFGTFLYGIDKIDHFIALLLLSVIGITMILESKENKELDDKLDFKTMFILSVATSIDALLVGITFSFLEANIIYCISIIGIITFIISSIGVLIGSKFGIKYGSKAELLGGIILILTGIRIFIEHIS